MVFLQHNTFKNNILSLNGFEFKENCCEAQAKGKLKI